MVIANKDSLGNRCLSSGVAMMTFYFQLLLSHPVPTLRLQSVAPDYSTQRVRMMIDEASSVHL